MFYLSMVVIFNVRKQSLYFSQLLFETAIENFHSKSESYLSTMKS